MKFRGNLLTFHRLPGRYFLVAAGTIITAATGWTRFILSMVNWNLYQQLGVNPGVWYLLLIGLLTGLVYTAAAGLIFIQPVKWKRILVGLLISGLVLFWIDRICFATSQDARIGLPFSLLFSTGLTLIAFILMIGKTANTDD